MLNGLDADKSGHYDIVLIQTANFKHSPTALLFLPITSNNPSFQFPNGLLTSRPTPDTHKKWSLTSIPNGDCYLPACSPPWMVAW